MERRVVVTGIGSVSPFGLGTKVAWERLLNGDSCISMIESLDLGDCSVKIGGEIKWSKHGGWFNPADHMPHKDVSRVGRFIVYAIAAGSDAMKDAGLSAFDEEDAKRFGVILGTGAGGMDTTEDGIHVVEKKGCRALTPFFVPGLLCNLPCGHLSIKYNAQGPSFAVVSACASGNHAIGEAYKMIKDGSIDVAMSGGTESTYNKSSFAGFASLRALSTRNDDPTGASRPYDKSRDGFVMSEGGAVLILEEYEHAKKRGAKIYGEIVGYGLSSDSSHITAPHPEGRGAKASMECALNNAKLDKSAIGYINAHGTSTQLGDAIEIMAVRKVFGDNVKNIPISSTKSATGHMLGAAAALEAVFCLMALKDNIIPATINLHNPDDSCKDLNLVPLTPQKKKVDYIMSNAFGFGGCNATIIFGRI